MVLIAVVLLAGVSAPDFSAALHGELPRQGNLFYSPASIRIALGMALAGARGETAAELRNAIQLEPQDAAQLLSSLAAVNGGAARLRIASRVWAQQGLLFSAAYLGLLQTAFRSELGKADFARDPEGSRRAIDAWVSEATERMIPSLFPPGSITQDARLVLANAVYFQGTWQSPFRKEATHDAPFFTGDGEGPAPLMYREGHYGLARLDGAMMIELPYDGNRMVMDVVLPAARDGIAEVEKRYAAHGVQPWLDQLKSVEVQLWLPRFKAQWGGELTGPLRALGIRQAFTNQADFTGIARTQDLRIAAVEHRAAVEVDEIGTKAVAATGIGIPAKAEPRREEKVKFRADHPFLYLIRDTRSGTVLFVGRLENPLQ